MVRLICVKHQMTYLVKSHILGLYGNVQPDNSRLAGSIDHINIKMTSKCFSLLRKNNLLNNRYLNGNN